VVYPGSFDTLFSVTAQKNIMDSYIIKKEFRFIIN